MICNPILENPTYCSNFKIWVFGTPIFAEQNGGQDAAIACTVAALWTLTRMVLTKHCSKKNTFFIVLLLMWAGPYIPVNYPWYEHAKSSKKRWCLAVAANGRHNWAIRNLSRCISVVSGCLAPCFVFLRGEHLGIQTGNHGNTLYCVRITHGKRSQLLVYKRL